MNNQALANNLRIHRKRSGLSQREVGRLLGYRHQWQVSRHERSQTAPPLVVALAYETIFRVPVSVLFAHIQTGVEQTVEARLSIFARDLSQEKNGKARAATQKRTWLTKRRS
jgi:DNA-binding XRE family transcriptional regulator